MRIAIVAFAALVASVSAQAVTEIISPAAAAPSGCAESYTGEFYIAVTPVSSTKRSLSGVLTLTLEDGILLDKANRTGYIASNYQFQFDDPPQAGSIYTAGFSACSNGSLALGGSAVWYQCLSGSFYNLYDRHWAPQCEEILLGIVPATAGTTTTATSEAIAAATDASSSFTVSSLGSTGSLVATVFMNSSSVVTGIITATGTATLAGSNSTFTAAGSLSVSSLSTVTGSSSSKATTHASSTSLGASSSVATGAAAAPTAMARVGALAAGLLGVVAMF